MRKLIFILIAIVSFSQAQTIQYIGAPTTTVISKGNFRTDSIFYLPKRTKLPTDTAAFRYQISDSSLYVWSGYQWLRAGGSGSINGTLTTNYIPKATGTATIGNSLLYVTGDNLLFKSISPWSTNTGWSTFEINASSVALNVFKINDTARGYVAHNGTLMEINNLRNGDLTFVTNSSTRGRFTSGGDFRVNTLGGTGSRVVVASSNGTLSAGSSATDLIDTTYISSRAWRQKGVDSVQFNVGLKVNISDTSSMLTPYLRKVDTTAMLSPYYRSATATAALATKLNISDTSTMLSPYIRHAGYGLTKTSQALSVDTVLMATRLRVGKVVDSLGGVIATKGSGTVTSVATGYGLSGGTITTTGTLIADTALVASRLRLGKVADSLSLVKQNVLTNPVTGTGTTNYVPKFTGTSTIGNSQIFDNGSRIGINTISPSVTIHALNSQPLLWLETNESNKTIAALQALNSEVRFSSTYNIGGSSLVPLTFYIGTTEEMRLSEQGELLINTITDNGNYTIQNNGSLFNNGDIYFNVGVGFTSLITQTLGGGGVGMVSRIDPTASGNRLFSLGFGSINYPAQARFEAYASEAWTSTARGTYLTLRTTPNGSTGVQDRMFIGNDGFIGVNTNSPLARMHVAGNFRTDNDAYFATSSGSIGIGRTNPSNKVDLLVNTNGFDGYNVYGQQGGGGEIIGFRSQQANGIGLVMGTTGAFATSTISGANQSVIYSVGNQNLIIGTNTTEALRINASQETLFGTTTDAGNYRVQVNGNAYVTGETALGVTSGNVQFGSTLNAWGSQYKVIQNQRTSFFSAAGYGWSGIAFNLYNDNTNYKYSSTNFGGEYRFDVIDGSHNFLTAVSGTADNNATVTNRFRIGNEGIVSVNTTSPNASAQLDVSSTTRGFLPPRMTTTQRDLISSPAAGLVIYNTTTSKLQVYTTSWTDLH